MVSEQTDIFRLYLLRHAHAGWALPDVSDFDRPLDAKGIGEARNVALQAFVAGLAPEKVVSSPARRCAETTAVFLETFGTSSASYDQRLYSEGLEAYLDTIRTHQGAASLMLVGHNPMIESLASFLSVQSSSDGAATYGYPTAGLLALDFHRPVTGLLRKRGHPVLMLAPTLT